MFQDHLPDVQVLVRDKRTKTMEVQSISAADELKKKKHSRLTERTVQTDSPHSVGGEEQSGCNSDVLPTLGCTAVAFGSFML